MKYLFITNWDADHLD